MKKLRPDIKKQLLFDMLRIRMIENRIDSLYLGDEMKTPVHLCNGQEGIAVGVCSTLDKSDYITSNHRGHGHYLAKGGNLESFIAELFGKKNGCSGGYGGSMHLIDKSVGHLGSSSIVGGGIPIGTGLGLAVQMKKTSQVSVVFFGDGAADEGVLYESINFAILKRLPVIYILENNQWSVCSHVSVRQAGDNIFHQASNDLLLTRKIDGNDILRVYQTACDAVSRARNGQGPSFIECRTYRILGHAGCASQDQRGYRRDEDVEKWKKRCPIKSYTDFLIQDNILTHKDVQDMKKRLEKEIDQAFDFAVKSPSPRIEDLDKNVFCD